MKTLFCVNLGLGDFINYVPLMVEVSKTKSLLVPVLNVYIENCNLLVDRYNIELLSTNTNDYDYNNDFKNKYRATGGEVLGFGHYSDVGIRGETHVTDGYESIGYDFKSLCKNKDIYKQSLKVKQIKVPEIPYAFVPEGGSSYDYRIKRSYIDRNLMIITPPQNSILLSYADIIYNATEIHCHDTAYPWYINQMPVKGRLYFHRYVRDFGYFFDKLYLHNWQELPMRRPIVDIFVKAEKGKEASVHRLLYTIEKYMGGRRDLIICTTIENKETYTMLTKEKVVTCENGNLNKVNGSMYSDADYIMEISPEYQFTEQFNIEQRYFAKGKLMLMIDKDAISITENLSIRKFGL
jgi:hypothetical protein